MQWFWTQYTTEETERNELTLRRCTRPSAISPGCRRRW
jgi:hypothetical protein